MTFKQSLNYGLAGETLIARWFQRRGWTVLPVYEKVMDTGKGPTLFLPDRKLIAPDMFVFNSQKAWWIEAKHKTGFSWNRTSQRWVTGIDLNHYMDYLLVEDLTPWPVWLLFLQRGGQAKDSPISPSGLFGNALDYLRNHESHRSQKYGSYGMVYWSIDVLKKMSDIKDIVV